MKKLTIIALLTSLSFAVLAQSAKEYKTTPKGDVSQTTIVIENLFADLVIEGTASNEIIIQTDDYEGIPEKAKGLKPLSSTGPENTGIGLNVQQEGNMIKISGASRKADGEYYLKVPKNIKLKVDLNSWQGGDFQASGLANEVEVKTQNGDLDLRNITGPLVAHSLSGDIEVDFSTISQSTPTSITSTSGDVDITLPSSTKGNFKLSTVSGEIYTDVEFDFEDDEKMTRWGGGMSADATLNGGGVDITFKSISGDVYIRGK